MTKRTYVKAGSDVLALKVALQCDTKDDMTFAALVEHFTGECPKFREKNGLSPCFTHNHP